MAELDVNRIASAALAIADELGSSGFSMRAVAARLGVTPMALYHHVKDKAELAGLTVEAAMAEVPLPAMQDDWRSGLLEMAGWMRQLSQAHPAVARLRREHKVWLPTMAQHAEQWLQLWRASGLGHQQAATAASASTLAIIGLVEEEQNLLALEKPDPALLNKVPSLAALLDMAENSEKFFELTVLALIDGLHSNLRHTGN